MRGSVAVLASLGLLMAAAPAEAAYNGFYFGLEGGYESNSSDTANIMFAEPEPVGSASQQRRGGTGPAYGIFAGFAFELSERIFASIEGGAGRSHAGFKFVDLDAGDAPMEGQGVRAATRESFHISSQLGYMVLERLGIYARIGLPGAKVSYRSLGSGSSAIARDSSYFSSYMLGGGLQFALGEHLFSRVEYTYSDLDVGVLDSRHRLMFGIGLGY